MKAPKPTEGWKPGLTSGVQWCTVVCTGKPQVGLDKYNKSHAGSAGSGGGGGVESD